MRFTETKIQTMAEEAEMNVARRLVRGLISEGYALGVDNSGGEEYACKPTTDAKAVIAALNQTGQDILRVFVPNESETGRISREYCGLFLLVYGMEPGLGPITDGSDRLWTRTDAAPAALVLADKYAMFFDVIDHPNPVRPHIMGWAEKPMNPNG